MVVIVDGPKEKKQLKIGNRSIINKLITVLGGLQVLVKSHFFPSSVLEWREGGREVRRKEEWKRRRQMKGRKAER